MVTDKGGEAQVGRAAVSLGKGPQKSEELRSGRLSLDLGFEEWNFSRSISKSRKRWGKRPEGDPRPGSDGGGGVPEEEWLQRKSSSGSSRQKMNGTGEGVGLV